MEVKCFCILCKKHPLFEKRKELKCYAGSNRPTEFNSCKETMKTGVKVDCFYPTNSKIEEGRLDVEELTIYDDYHYWDGYGAMEADWDGDDVMVHCENEENVDDN